MVGSPTFRGITAPASLKPLAAALALPNDANLPGHNSPGLIEAGRRRARWRTRFTCLPGHNSPGLIEALPSRLWQSVAGALPGHNSPGLIEAPPLSLGLPAFADPSGA